MVHLGQAFGQALRTMTAEGRRAYGGDEAGHEQRCLSRSVRPCESVLFTAYFDDQTILYSRAETHASLYHTAAATADSRSRPCPDTGMNIPPHFGRLIVQDSPDIRSHLRKSGQSGCLP